MITDSELKDFVRKRIFDRLDFWGEIDGSRIGISIFGGRFLIYENGLWKEYDEIPTVQTWLSVNIKFGERVREYIGANAPEKCSCMIATCLYFPGNVQENVQENWVNRLDETFRYIYYRSLLVSSSVRVGLGNNSIYSIYNAIALNYNCYYLSQRGGNCDTGEC